MLAAFYIKNDIGTGVLGHDVGNKSQHHLVGINDFSCLADKHDPVTVAVKSNSQRRFFADCQGNQILQVFLPSWIRVVIGEITIGLTIKGNYLTTQRGKQHGCAIGSDTIATINHDFIWFLKHNIATNGLDIVGFYIDGRERSASCMEILTQDPLFQAGNLIRRQAIILQDNFYPVVIPGVMAAGDHYPGVCFQGMSGKVHQRRRAGSDIDNIAAR